VQTVLNFKLESTNEKLTPRTGVAILGEYLKGMQLEELCNSYLPTSNFEANSFYFQIGTLAYKLFLLFKLILDKSLQKHTVKTIRYKLYNIASKVISHARETILKVNDVKSDFLALLGTSRFKKDEIL